MENQEILTVLKMRKRRHPTRSNRQDNTTTSMLGRHAKSMLIERSRYRTPLDDILFMKQEKKK